MSTKRRWLWVAGLLAICCVALPAWAANQKVADDIAARLRDSGQLHDYHIAVKFQDGTATLSGEVTNAEEARKAAYIAAQSPDVKQVVNQITVAPKGAKPVAKEKAPSASAPAVEKEKPPLYQIVPQIPPVPPGGTTPAAEEEKPPVYHQIVPEIPPIPATEKDKPPTKHTPHKPLFSPAAAASGNLGLPLGIPPGPEDPALARVAPEQCLFYASWAGIAPPDAKNSNQTEQLLAEPEVQNCLKQIDGCIRQVVHKLREEDQGDNAAYAEDALEAVRIVLNHPAALFVGNLKLKDKAAGKDKPADKAKTPDKKPADKELESIDAGIVLSLGGDAARVKTAMEAALRDCPEIKTIQIEGEKWYRGRSGDDNPAMFAVWGFHGNYLIAAFGEKGAADIVHRMKKEPPKWLAAVQSQVPIQRRSTLTYINLRGIADLVLPCLETKQQTDARAVLEMLGLGNAASLVQVSGLDGEDLVDKTLLALDGEPRGLLRLVSDRPLRPEDLTPIPRDATLAAAFRLDLQQAMDIVLSSIEKMSPEMRGELARGLDEIERTLGVDLRHGVLQALGDTWCVYNSPGEGGFICTGLTAVVPVRDRPGLSLAYGRLMGLARQRLAPPREPTLDLTPRVERFRFEGRDVYCLNVVAAAPAWCMTEQEMIFALSPQNVKAYLSRGAGHESLGRLPRVANLLSGADAPAVVAYCDTPRLFELFYPWVSLYGPAISNGLRMAGADVDLSLMPSAAAIGRHLRPGVVTVRRTRHGIELASRATLPLPSVMTWVALSAASTLSSTFVHDARRTVTLGDILGDEATDSRPPKFDPDAVFEHKPSGPEKGDDKPAKKDKDEKQDDDAAWNSARHNRMPVLGPYKQGAKEDSLVEPPSEKEILELLEEARPMQRAPRPAMREVQRTNVHFTTELLKDEVDPPRVYPLVGPAQLHRRHYKCIVSFTEEQIDHSKVPYRTTSEDCQEVIYIDRDHLHTVGNVEGKDGKKETPPLTPQKPIGQPEKADGKATSQVRFVGPEGMVIQGDQQRLVAPARHNFARNGIYRLRLSDIPGRRGTTMIATLNVPTAVPRTEAFLAHNAIPVNFTEEDFDQAVAGKPVVKVVYLPDPAFQELALAGVETLVGTRLDPGVDPLVEADRRGAIIAFVRVSGNAVTAGNSSPIAAP